jgi:glutamine synthetase
MSNDLTASVEELKAFLAKNPNVRTLEIIAPDMAGVLRGKRIPRVEFETFFTKGVQGPGSTPLLNTLGDLAEEVGIGHNDGDPDKILRPIKNSLALIPWLKSETAQVMATWFDLEGEPHLWDPRQILNKVVRRLASEDMHPTVACELEFYLVEASDNPARPQVKLSRIPGTTQTQPGVQYAMPEELWEQDDFLEAVRIACEQQNIPATTVHTEFAPGQYEINLHHVDDALLACDHAVLLKRVIKGVARQFGMCACFMAKPFADSAGNGLHMHISMYDGQNQNLFLGPDNVGNPPISDAFRHAIGGLADTMADCMAIFAPNANSYRRIQPGNYVPLTPNWGHNHRSVALRIPACDGKNMRIEHRVAGADANPYLVLAAVLAGMHYGMKEKCEPHGEMIRAGELFEDETVTVPYRWDTALDTFKAGTVLPEYFGEDYFELYERVRRSECNQFYAQVSDVDYAWYLRAV